MPDDLVVSPTVEVPAKPPRASEERVVDQAHVLPLHRRDEFRVEQLTATVDVERDEPDTSPALATTAEPIGPNAR